MPASKSRRHSAGPREVFDISARLVAIGDLVIRSYNPLARAPHGQGSMGTVVNAKLDQDRTPTPCYRGWMELVGLLELMIFALVELVKCEWFC